MQFIGGYILDGIQEALVHAGYSEQKLNSLLESLGYFNIDLNTHLVRRTESPELCVLHNFLQRGIPTYMSIDLLDSFIEAFPFLKKEEDELGSIKVHLNGEPNNLLDYIYRAFHIVDPSINTTRQFYLYNKSWENLGSSFEEDFYFNSLSDYIHQSLFQLVETQRDLVSILHYSTKLPEEFQKYLEGSIENLVEQNVDFSIELPFEGEGGKGIVVEIDGPQHDEQQQKKQDEMRDEAVLKAGWHKTIRIKTEEFARIGTYLNPLNDFSRNEYCERIRENYDDPLIGTAAGRFALQLVLSPVAIARIQKVLMELLISGHLTLKDKKWRIAVLERDVPCAGYAIKDFLSIVEKLYQILDRDFKVPELELTLISKADIAWELNRPFQSNIIGIKEISDEGFDLFIDISVLRRHQIIDDAIRIKSNIYTKIRSSFSPRIKRNFLSSELIKYPQFIVTSPDNALSYDYDIVKAYLFFLQSTFRKRTFREGQLDILNKALHLDNVVGLLPTGSGKSLTYQLSVLLQPGFSIIVDPIKSLMKDQYEGLISNRIDCVNYINSSIKSAWLRQKHMQKMSKGQVLYTFISPERFQIRAFREKLLEMTETNSNYFSYCIIDEAHCVSEWGHDFRTAYLKLGENARKFCKIKGAIKEHENDEYHPPVTMIGLTATASFDVLSDVQRELELSDESIITLESLKRNELRYMVERVEVRSNRYLSKWDQLELLGETKQKNLAELLLQLPAKYSELNDQLNTSKEHLDGITTTNFFHREDNEKICGLIFCPHRTWHFGVENVYLHLKQNLDFLNFGTFVGSSSNEDTTKVNEENISESNQDSFKKNEIDVLVATKAFGMGIDKSNIRYTVHFNFPSSIESFYQEAGRAGRDRKLALCYILYCDHEHDKEILLKFHQNSFKGIDKEISAVYELLTEITYPSVLMSNEITELILEELGFNVYLNFWPKDNPRRLYANESYGSGYGYIDLYSKDIMPDDRTFDYDKSESILHFIKDYIEENKEDFQEYLEFLEGKVEDQPAPGIEEILSTMEFDEPSVPILIGFTNDKIRKITDYLQDYVDSDFTQRIVADAQEYCYTPDEFLKNLRNKFRKAHNEWINISEEASDVLSDMFIKIRSEQDTYRAIYRLSIIGVIDDYEVDYGSKNITVFISKKKDGHYLEKLYLYLKRYVSEERARLVYEEINEYEGDTLIRKCINYLINFVYTEIAKKRRGAIDNMEEACIKGLESNELFEEFIEIYFDSKYYPDLVEDTEKGREFDFDIVWKYIDLVKGNVDNIKHLRGASTRLLTDNPENGALLLLRAFAIILIESSNERFFKESKELIKKALKIYREIKEYEIDDLLQNINNFISLLENEEPSAGKAGEMAKTEFFSEQFINWIENFNNEFLEDYERTR